MYNNLKQIIGTRLLKTQSRIDTDAHISTYICIESVTKLYAKIKQVPFENVPQV